jgi:hypothetical protein
MILIRVNANFALRLEPMVIDALDLRNALRFFAEK